MQIIIKIYFKCSIVCCGKYSVCYDYFNKFFYVDYVTFCGVLLHFVVFYGESKKNCCFI